MKGLVEKQRQSRRNITRTELILGAIVLGLLLKLYYPGSGIQSDHQVEQDNKIFQCHAPQPNLLNSHEIDRSVFDSDIKWVEGLLDGFVKGNNGYGDGADSVTLSIFLPNGPAIYEAGFGKVRANESESHAPDGNSIYRMASITKMFTTAQLILQKQRGELDLDEDVANILDDFHPSNKGWTGIDNRDVITTRQLLSHTSGLLRDDPLNIHWPMTREDLNLSIPVPTTPRVKLMEKIRDTPAVMSVSSTPTYSNIGFQVAGWVAQEIAKTEYSKLLERDVFKPLGMAASFFIPPSDKLDRIIVPGEPARRWADWSGGEVDPAGDMYSSAADLRRFGQELLQYGADIDAKSSKTGVLYKGSTKRDWLRPVHVFDDHLISIGLVWEIFTVPLGSRRMTLYCKGGTLPGYHTLFCVDPEREFGYSLLISGEPLRHNELAIRISKRFARTLDGQRQNILVKDFVGTYVDAESNVIKIELVDGGLAMTQAVVDGDDLFKSLHLGEGEGNFVAMWPTGEHAVWRLAIGRPPAQPYLGCMLKFASIDPAFSKGFPVDLVVIENGKLVYGALNKTFVRK